MRILIAGASGAIGRPLVRACLAVSVGKAIDADGQDTLFKEGPVFRC
jgi:nucleoside-diphosphate-sugar epimerase